ncbi:hypothetical protein [Brucella haematophila]|uniref:Uncharacterized protein n=1 Tax=Brucella haematophila TaxID=419474 RepID=A0ABX1DK73_9HYPH|nr:hypothetical protein [Brucella haematophila]NKC03319.1 hypothetical protein [Brucella haematophila]TMU84701.1 hypothetical protein FGI60_26010 [Brucella haematophila]
MHMAELTIHHIRKIEVVSAFPDNFNSRVVRITSDNGEIELTLFGDTNALDLLPRSSDFVVYGKSEAA